uniref:DUF38 domain-containing protein n=1 Tax=Strongyloides stercoralis TaxID=6248 RepID=A0A0K0EF60_STRER
MDGENKCQSLQKPELIELTVSSVKIDGTEEIIEVVYIIDPKSKILHSTFFPLEPVDLIFKKINEYEDFLKLFDFSRLLKLQFYINSSTEVIKLFNKYNTNPNSFFSISINDSGELGERNSKDILNLINNIENSNEMHLTFNFPHQEAPEDFNFPKMRSLKVISVKEVNGTQFLSKEIISNLLNDCPSLRSVKLSSINKGIYYETVKLILAKQTSIPPLKCRDNSFNAHFVMDDDLRPIIVHFYQSLFEDKQFKVNVLCFPYDNGNFGYSLYGYKKCENCTGEHVVNIFFEVES